MLEYFGPPEAYDAMTVATVAVDAVCTSFYMQKLQLAFHVLKDVLRETFGGYCDGGSMVSVWWWYLVVVLWWVSNETESNMALPIILTPSLYQKDGTVQWGHSEQK